MILFLTFSRFNSIVSLEKEANILQIASIYKTYTVELQTLMARLPRLSNSFLSILEKIP